MHTQRVGLFYDRVKRLSQLIEMTLLDNNVLSISIQLLGLNDLKLNDQNGELNSLPKANSLLYFFLVYFLI